MDHRQFPLEALKITPVDENSTIPLYQQVRIDLMGMLQSGKLTPGDMLPPENDLARAYQVSRQTVRQAIGLMATQNLLERTAGRGTTVIATQDHRTFYLDQSFAQQIIQMGLAPRSEVLRKKITMIDSSAPVSLHSKKGSQALDLIRLRFGDEDPIGVQYTTVVTDLCPDLQKWEFKQESLYDLLINHYKLPIVRIDHSISAIVADDWHKNLLKIREFAPLLLVKTTAYMENNEPIESSTSYYRADKYEFSMTKHY